MTSWDETLSDNGIMMREGEAAKALALGVSEKVTLSGSTESFAVLDMCNTVGQKVEHGFCDALDTAISVLAPCFEDSNGDAYPSDLSSLSAKAGISTVVYGATTGEIRLKNAGALFDSTYIYQRKLMLNLMVTVHQEEEPVVITPITTYAGERLVNTGYLSVDDSELEGQGVTWTSSDPSIATIDSNTGFVTVVSDGTCTFTATGVADNTKVGASTVSCLKIMDDNMCASINTMFESGSTVSLSGVTATVASDGSVVLNGTLTTNKEFSFHVTPMATSGNTIVTYFPADGIAGDMLVWLEHLDGTVSDASSFSGYDFLVKLYDINNTELSGYRLKWQEKPPFSSGSMQAMLITGSTAGIRRIDLAIKRPTNTVFDNYKLRIGLKKYSSLGKVYDGGLLEQYFPAVYSVLKIAPKNVAASRNPDGSFLIRAAGSMYVFSSGKYGYVQMTSLVTHYTNSSEVPATVTIAPSGTYKFKVKVIAPCTHDASGSEATAELSFVLIDSNKNRLAVLHYIYQNEVTDEFDSNGEAETTFTADADIVSMCVYHGNIRISTDLYFAAKLEAAT